MTRLSFVLLLSSLSLSYTNASSFGGIGRNNNIIQSSILSLPRGGETGYANLCEEVKSSIAEKAHSQIDELRRKIIDESTIIDDLGSQADKICNQALAEFAQNAPTPSDTDQTTYTIYDKKLEELESTLDAHLHVLYLRQLSLLREAALTSYRSSTNTSSDTSDYEAMLQADSYFIRLADASTRRESSDWEYASERGYLQSIMNDLASARKRLVDVQMKNSEKQSTAMAFLQQQQQMIQQLQMQLYGQSSPWNVGLAYRIPDTNFNVQGSYQQGRANVQLSCVPDEYAPMLGANGFTNGVGPGNLGLSLNLSL